MVKTKTLLFILLGITYLCNQTACKQHLSTKELLIQHATSLLDSTLQYYHIKETCLFSENYPPEQNATATYLAEPDTAHVHKAAYLWPTSGMFSAINALLKVTGDERYATLLDSLILPGLQCYHDTVRKPDAYQSYLTSSGLSDRYYDDNIWLGIDFVESYELTKKPAFLESAEAIWHFLESGRDTLLGDGIYWCEQKKFSKNTCSNAPAAVLALKLYRATKNELYLKAGKELYHWTKNTLQDMADNLYFDNIRLADAHIGKTKYAYNSGQMLQAGALLYQLTGEPQYLEAIKKLAQACGTYFFQHSTQEPSHKVLKDGNIWFTAILLRGFEEMYRIDHNPRYLHDFITTLDQLWACNKNKEGLFDDNRFAGSDGNGDTHKWLLTQAALIEMYARLSAFDIEKQ